MADKKGPPTPKSAAPGQLRRKRKQQQRRRRPPFLRRKEAAAEGGGEDERRWLPPPPPPPPFPPPEWEEGEGPWAAPEREGRGRGRPGKRSRGGPRGRGGKGGRPWRGRRGGPWGPPGMDEGRPAEREGRGGPWGPPDGEGRGPWGPGERPWDDWDERHSRGPAEEDRGPPPWGPHERDEREEPWGPPEMDGGPPPGRAGERGPWAPSEEEQPWGGPEMDERPPPPRREGRGRGRGGRWAPPERGSRERSWPPPERESRGRSREPPERNSQGPPEREGREPSRGSPRRGISPTREVWAPPQEGLWGGPDHEMHRSRLPNSLGWESHREAPRRRWGSPREEARQGLGARESRAPLRGQRPAKPWRGRSESPAEERERNHPPEKLRRIRLGGPEGREGEKVPPGRSQIDQDSLEWVRRQQDPNRPWREDSGKHSYPSRYQLQLEAVGIEGPWSGPEAMEGEHPGPSREEWDWDRPRWQTAEERDQYSPKWEEERECFRGQSPLEQGGRGHLSQYDGESATESPHRQWHPEGHLASFQGVWGPRGDRVDKEIEQDWKEEEGHGGGGGDLNANTLTAGPPPAPKEWTPCEQVLSFWERCRAVLKKKPRRYMLATCPRPTLPDRSSETPELNSSVSAMLKPHQQREIACATRALHTLQDEVLDMLGPAMTVYEMAEEALAKGEAVDPMELREWARCLVRFIGSISENLTLQRRVVVLGAIHPRLKCVTTKMTSQSTGGLLFAEDKVKLLKEIIKRFPQLAQNPQTPRRAHPFLRPPYSRRRPPVRSAPRHLHNAEKPYRRSPADQREEEHH